MSFDDFQREKRRQRRIQALGVPRPSCATCPENDPFCLELHHIAGRAYSDETVILCSNCHKKQSDRLLSCTEN
jgi:hypothetical protein